MGNSTLPSYKTPEHKESSIYQIKTFIHTAWNFIKPTPDKILTFLLLLLLKQIILFFPFLPSISGNTFGSGLIFAILLIMYPELFIIDIFGWYENDMISQILYSYTGIILLYLISLFIHRLIRIKINFTSSTVFSGIKPVLWTLFSIVLVFPLITFVPTKGISNSFTQMIDYVELAKPSYHTTPSLEIPDEGVIDQFPEIQLVELWRISEESSLIPIDRILDKLFSPLVASIYISVPAYTYVVDNDQIILGPDITCVDLEKSSLLIADGWSDALVPVEKLPVQVEDNFLHEPIDIYIQSIHPDKTVVITRDGNEVSIPPNKEFIMENRKTGVFWGNVTTWVVRNLGTVKVQCSPDFVYNTE